MRSTYQCVAAMIDSKASNRPQENVSPGPARSVAVKAVKTGVQAGGEAQPKIAVGQQDNAAAFGVPGPVAEAIMAATWLLARTPGYAELSLSALEYILFPPVRLGQYRLYRRQGQPFALVAWALIDEAVERRVRSGGEGLKPVEWNCGDRRWPVMLVCPFGGEENVKRDIAGAAEFRLLKVDGGELAVCNDTGDTLARLLDVSADGGRHESALESIPGFQVVSECDVRGQRIRFGRINQLFVSHYPDQLLNLCRLLLAGPNYAHLAVEPTLLLRSARLIVARPSSVAIAAVAGDDIVGFIVGETMPIAFNTEKFAANHAFIILPEFRSQGLGRELLRQFEIVARRSGATHVRYSHTSGISPAKAERAFLRTGAAPIGSLYWKVLR